MKYTRVFPRKKAAAIFLVLCLLSFLFPGMVVKPSVAGAAPGSLQLSVGNYRGLSQEVTVPVSIKSPSGVAALTFKVAPSSSDVTVESVTRGAGLPANAEMVPYIPQNKSYANVGIYLSSGNIKQGGDLVNISFAHNESEGSGPFTLELTIIDAFDADGERINSTPVNGYIDVKVMYGDLNRSDTVTVADALLAMNAVVGSLPLSQELKDAGNVSRASSDPAGNLTIYDVLLIAQYAAGIRNYFPVNDPGDASSPPPPPPPGNAVAPTSLTVSNAVYAPGTVFTVGFDVNVSDFVNLELRDNGGNIIPIATNSINNSNSINIVGDVSGIAPGTYDIIITHMVAGGSTRSLEIPDVSFPLHDGSYYP